MIAVSRIRRQPHYRAIAFEDGLRRAGFELRSAATPRDRRDWLVIWNRYGPFEAEADRWERAGGSIIVVENGYCGLDAIGRQLYAIALDGHNGSGRWPSGSGRFERLGAEVRPWRTGDGYALVCGQRGIGSRTMASPREWEHRLKLGDARVRIRQHPGRFAPARSLAEDLAGASACVIWSSGCGVAALLAGVPVFYTAPHWICEGAARRFAGSVAEPLADDAARAAALERMAWAQWTIAEIESGEPFVRLRELAC